MECKVPIRKANAMPNGAAAGQCGSINEIPHSGAGKQVPHYVNA